jgi:hypothetical protein
MGKLRKNQNGSRREKQSTQQSVHGHPLLEISKFHKGTKDATGAQRRV